jgi:hypothetical protein
MAIRKFKPGDTEFKDRYPIHRGPFLFGPQFLSEAAWFPNFERLIEDILERINGKASIVRPYASGFRVARVEFAHVEMTIDAQGGIFSVDQLGSSELPFEEMPTFSVGPCGAPEQFFVELKEPQYVNLMGPDFKQVKEFSVLLYRLMKHRFRKATENGFAQVAAYVGDPFSDLRPLEFWQLQHIRIKPTDREEYYTDDRKLDEAVGDGGIKIFGLGVAPLSAVRTDTGVLAIAISGARRATRGRKKSVDYESIDKVGLELMRVRGKPNQSTPTWNNEVFQKAVRERLGPSAPSRNTVLKIIPPLIKKFDKQLHSSRFQQSTKSKKHAN